MNKHVLNEVRKKIDNIITMSPYPEDIFHSINTYEWVLKLDPTAKDDIALMLASIGHDIERGMGDRCVKTNGYETYDEYKQAHAINSAEILVGLLEENGVEQPLITISPILLPITRLAVREGKSFS